MQEPGWGFPGILPRSSPCPHQAQPPIPGSLLPTLDHYQHAFQWSITSCLSKQGAEAKGDGPWHLYPRLNSICSNACYTFSVPFLPPFCQAQPSHRPGQKGWGRVGGVFFVQKYIPLFKNSWPNIPPLIRVTLGGQKQKDRKALLGTMGFSSGLYPSFIVPYFTEPKNTVSWNPRGVHSTLKCSRVAKPGLESISPTPSSGCSLPPVTQALVPSCPAAHRQPNFVTGIKHADPFACASLLPIIYVFKDFACLFWERGEGEEKEREGNIDVWENRCASGTSRTAMGCL